MAYLYILHLRDNTHYCGITKNIERRITQHVRGESKSTKYKRPVKIKYVRKCVNIAMARKEEVKIKRQGVSRWWIKNKNRNDNMIVTKLIGGE